MSSAPQRRFHAVWLTFAAIALIAGGCRSTYYNTMEAFGRHKRDILVDRVEEARDEQAAAREQFRDALEAFQAVVATPRTDLSETYERLSEEYEASASRAADVRERIASIHQVATDLFEEWEDELDDYASEDLRRRSAQTLAQTQQRYAGLRAAMVRAAESMEPVLATFADHVLFLKHNLNAQAVASLQGETASLQSDVARLVQQMEAAIAEADAFIAAMTEEPVAPLNR